MDPDPGDPKTRGSGGSGTLLRRRGEYGEGPCLWLGFIILHEVDGRHLAFLSASCLKVSDPLHSRESRKIKCPARVVSLDTVAI